MSKEGGISVHMCIRGLVCKEENRKTTTSKILIPYSILHLCTPVKNVISKSSLLSHPSIAFAFISPILTNLSSVTMAIIPMPTEVKDINYLLKYQFKLLLSMMLLTPPPAAPLGLASFISSMKSTSSFVPRAETILHTTPH